MRHVVAALLGLIVLNANASGIRDSWYAVDQDPNHSTVVFSFFPNGEYFLNDYGIQALDPSGHPGIERGTYSWNEATGAFSSTTLLNADGEWGLSHSSISEIHIAGNALTAGGPDGGVATRLSPDPTSAIVGGWYERNVDEPGDLLVIDFLPNGTYLLGGSPPLGSAEPSLFEYGTYTWNPNGSFQSHVIYSSDVDSGLSGGPIFSVVVRGGQLVISAGDGVFTLNNVAAAAVPEPEAFVLMLVGFGLIGAFTRRTGKPRGHPDPY